MGLFDALRNKGNRKKEETIIIDGYEITKESGTLLHCPTGLKEYRIPSQAKIMTNEAWLDMKSSAEKIIIPPEMDANFRGSVYSLESAKKLKEIQLGEGIKNVNLGFELTRRVKINIPKSLEHLSAGMYETSPDGKVVIGDNVKSMDNLFASHDCGIREVEIMGNIEEVADSAFNQCRNIEKVVLHEGVKRCGQNAFRGTNKLKLVDLPDGFEGSFDAETDSRPCESSHMGKESKYDGKSYEADMVTIMTIRIHRGEKCFSLTLPRGELGSISVYGNEVTVNKGLTIDLTKLDERATHSITKDGVRSIMPKNDIDDMRRRYQQNPQPQHRQSIAPRPQSQQRQSVAPRQQPAPISGKSNTQECTAHQIKLEMADMKLATLNTYIRSMIKKAGFDENNVWSSVEQIFEAEENDELLLPSEEILKLEIAIIARKFVLENPKNKVDNYNINSYRKFLKGLEDQGFIEKDDSILRRASRARNEHRVSDYDILKLDLSKIERKDGPER